MECYGIAPPRVRQYLNSEIEYVKSRIGPNEVILELGCGYGRVVFELATIADRVVGIDTAVESIELARELGADIVNCEFAVMDAIAMEFSESHFDSVICVQNGVCAFGVDQIQLFGEAMRVAKPGGKIIFSSYSSRFWKDRLEWFEIQAAHGLVGEIDHELTGDNVIVFKDGFRIGAMDENGFAELCNRFGIDPIITAIDDSSIFCETIKE